MSSIKTLEQLETIVGRDNGTWFLSLVEANYVSSQLTLKEMASLFADGIEPMEKRWIEVLATLGDEDEDVNGNTWPTKHKIKKLMKEINW